MSTNEKKYLLAQTPAPKKDRIYGSKVNKEGSASSEKSAKSIKLSSDIIDSLSKKLKEFKENHKTDKVSLNDLKAVYRRGLGAYSTSHRPNIPRNGWAMARVNAFLRKAGGGEHKKAYVQDDDLLKMHLGGDMSKHLAPNGKPSNLTHEQWHLVRTPQFKAWFGDWENDPKNASKVVDDNGEPLVVYHSTDEKFNQFDYKTINDSANYYEIIGFYFTSNKPSKRSRYGNITKTCFLNIRDKILVTDPIIEKNPDWETKKLSKKQILSLIGNKNPVYEEYSKEKIIEILVNSNKLNRQLEFVYREFFSRWQVKDGIRFFLENLTDKLGFDGAYMPHSEYYVAFHPEQIKLADGTNTTFDGKNPDIRYADGGNIGQNIKCVNCGWDWNTKDSEDYDKYICHNCGFNNRTFYDSDPIGFKEGGEVDDKKKTYEKWKSLVNMSSGELKKFYESEDGKKAGLSSSEAKQQGIDSGRESARWIMKMKQTPKSKWTPEMWRWAKKQISFISRMSGVKGGLYKPNGEKTRKHLALLIWGHNPKKYDMGGNIISLPDTSAEFERLREILDAQGYVLSKKDAHLLKVAPSLEQIEQKHGVNRQYLEEQLQMGIKEEMEHTDNPEVAQTIALHHLYEDYSYYSHLEEMMQKAKEEEEYEKGIEEMIETNKQSEVEVEDFKYSKKFGEVTIYTNIEQEYVGNYYSPFENKGSFKASVRKSDLVNIAIESKELQDFDFKWGVDDWNTISKKLKEKKITELELYEVGKIIKTYELRKIKNYDNFKIFEEFGSGGISNFGKVGTGFDKYENTKGTYDNRGVALKRTNDLKTLGSKIIISMDSNNKFSWNLILQNGTLYASKGEFDTQQDAIDDYMSKDYDDGGEVELEGRFQKNLDELLKNEGWTISYYDQNINNVPKDKAVELSLSKFDPYYEQVSIKPIPKKVVFEWVMNKINKDKVYKSFAENFNKLLKSKGYEDINAYPTTYGIGTFVAFGKGIEETKSRIENLLKSLGIEFTTEYSDAQYVFRYKISKSKSNIEKINALSIKSMKKGGEIDPDNKQIKEAMTHKSGSAGGLLIGNRHSEGGIKAVNKSTDQPLEMEGGEVVITRKAVSDEKKREFDGEMLNNREILSKINESGGGVSFDKGGKVEDEDCGCEHYDEGGQTEIMMFGIQYPELTPSEMLDKIYDDNCNTYEEGGLIRLVHKKVYSLKDFISKNLNIDPLAHKRAYKDYLYNIHHIVFDELPQQMKMGLLLGNQKLIDKYINS